MGRDQVFCRRVDVEPQQRQVPDRTAGDATAPTGRPATATLADAQEATGEVELRPGGSAYVDSSVAETSPVGSPWTWRR